MSRLSRTKFNYILLGIVLGLLTLPLSGFQVTAPDTTSAATSSIVSPELQGIMYESTDEVLPIVVQFQSRYESQLIREVLEKSDIPDLTIRYVFETIPTAAVYATSEAIQTLQHLNGIEFVAYDHKRVIDSQPIEIEPDQFGLDSSYVHPDETLSADSIWAEGYDGSGVTVAVIDSGADGTHSDLEDRIIGFYDLIGGNHDLDPV
ncbi:MAG: hypothetical protein KAR33_12310, partial [Candidatus Thorarchaeota archaeon]|nr:hypothetical protein [Candidatus Thorarchaeota archaeon]